MSPTVRRRRLAYELLRRRKALGMTADQLGAKVDLSKSAISRIENAEVSVQPLIARGLLEALGVEGDELDGLVEISRDARKRGWWQSFGDVMSPRVDMYTGLETEAAEISDYQPIIVPALLQISDYTRALVRSVYPDMPEAEVDRRVELRMHRQQVQDRPKLWAVIDEAVLSRPIGGCETMRRQLEHLVEASRTPDVTLQVLPFQAGEHPALGSAYTILTFADARDQPVVYLETASSGHFVEGEEVHLYSEWFNHLRASALSERASRQRMMEASHPS